MAEAVDRVYDCLVRMEKRQRSAQLMPSVRRKPSVLRELLAMLDQALLLQ